MMECDACKRLADRIEMDDEWAGTTLGNIKTVSPAAIAQSAPSTSLDLDTLAEFDYRFNRRYDLAAMIPRLAWASVRTPPMPYRLLKLAEDHA
jgi:hypothetical protein